MKNSKVFWGIIFILAAVYAIIGQIGILPDISVFRILLTIFFVWTLIEGIRYIDFFRILMPLAFLYIIYDDVLGIEGVGAWTVLAASVLGSIGLTMIFGNVKKKRNYEQFKKESVHFSGNSSEQCTGEQLCVENTFGSASRYINSDNFKGAQIENNFGTVSVYFDNAIIQEGTAFVNVENNFGETNLYIPKEWQIRNNLERSFGAINDIGRSEGSSTTVLFLNGSANFGAINLHFI